MYSFYCIFPTCSTRIPPLSSCRVHVWHCPGAPRTSLDSLRDVGAVQVGAAVGAEVVASLYVDHRVSTHGALLFPACGHPPYTGIRFILLILAGTVPATAAIRPMRARSGKGVALHALDKAKEALECFDRAIKMDPDHAYAHSRKGSLLHNSESQAQNACSSAPT